MRKIIELTNELFMLDDEIITRDDIMASNYWKLKNSLVNNNIKVYVLLDKKSGSYRLASNSKDNLRKAIDLIIPENNLTIIKYKGNYKLVDEKELERLTDDNNSLYDYWLSLLLKINVIGLIDVLFTVLLALYLVVKVPDINVIKNSIYPLLINTYYISLFILLVMILQHIWKGIKKWKH